MNHLALNEMKKPHFKTIKVCEKKVIFIIYTHVYTKGIFHRGVMIASFFVVTVTPVG